MSESNAPAPSGVRFPFQDVDYILYPVTQGNREEFHAIAIANAMALVKLAGKYMSDVEAYQELQEARRLALSGYFWWDADGGLAYRYTKAGLIRLVSLCLKREQRKDKFDNGKVELETIRAMADIDYGRWLQGQYDLANPTQPPPTGDQNGNDSTPNSSSDGE